MIKKLNLRDVNIKLQKLRREIQELKETIFSWGQQNMKDIDEFKQLIKRQEEIKSK